MNLTDELRNLADLHEKGHLTDQEFAEAKHRLLKLADDMPVASAPPPKPSPIKIDPPIEEKMFKSSRWSSGNLFFPDRITLASDGITFRKGAMFGSSEEHISYPSIASFKVKNGIFLANITVETSGGTQPIFVNGLWKKAAREIQDTLKVHQRSA
ncbi:MAG: hypothetical protein JWM35_220 [Verrucomicrobia bacterium]|nr:hypothetical protein [Verrucomicrobiota bacterium]